MDRYFESVKCLKFDIYIEINGAMEEERSLSKGNFVKYI